MLRLSPGCTLTALKKRYREMAVVLHPDKSMVSSRCLPPQQAHPEVAVIRLRMPMPDGLQQRLCTLVC